MVLFFVAHYGCGFALDDASCTVCSMFVFRGHLVKNVGLLLMVGVLCFLPLAWPHRGIYNPSVKAVSDDNGVVPLNVHVAGIFGMMQSRFSWPADLPFDFLVSLTRVALLMIPFWGHGACGFLLLDTPPSLANSWPRSTKMGKRPPTSSPQHCTYLLQYPFLSIDYVFIAVILPFSYIGNALRGIVSSVSMPDMDAEVNVPQNALGNGTKTLGVPLRTSNLETAFTAMEEEGVTNTIVKEVGRDLQKDQLTRLESIEPPDHNTMLPAVNDTFYASVDSLNECRPFVERLV
ncbi:hypothetical protein F3Y22_tig00112738pilonHSYRG00503 [Hibiscus syriacus]|uniref:Uncharacterized protein n=1 Tax=Hibiscus syriacus TaxID=106335 RepID=A0A6A2Y6N5_HIBSY|nr:hypothetical protein F3Y22_tig00112738pilonHSYRG00503 [Hibiscus syriacus]